MALGFNYTLSPDEQSSWKSFEEFAKKVSDKGINVPLTFGDPSGKSGSQPKLALEKQVKEIQNQIHKALDSLVLKATDLDINDIIPIEDIRREIDNLSNLEAPLADIRHEGKLIKQQIQEWSTVTNNYGKDLEKLANLSEGLGEKVSLVVNSEKYEQEQKAMVDSTEQSALKIKLIQENLFNQLNKLTLKVDTNMLDGILPVDTLATHIKSLGQADESMQSVTLRTKELKLEMQQYAIVINNIDSIMEDMIQNNGKLSNSLNLQGDIVEKLEKSYDKLKSVKDQADNAQKQIEEKIQLIKTSKEYISASEREKARIDELTSSLKIQAFSVESVDEQMKAHIQTLEKEQTLLNAKYLDEARRKYDDLEGTIKNLVVRYVSLQAILHNVKAYFQDVMQYTKDLDDAYTDVAISMDITREEFNAWTKDARAIAQANGQTTTSLMEMVKIYAQAGEDITAVQDKLAGTAMIQNITQWDAEQATSAVNSIINQYKLMDREINGVVGDTANAIQYIGDNLIGISNALSIDNVKGIQEMVSAVDDAGSVIYNAGGSLEWFMGVTGALAEATNSTGSEIGATMRMVTARTLRQGDAISELEAQGEDLEIAMAKAERALEGIGVSIRGETADSLRDIEDIIGDVANAWDTLSDSERQAVSEAMAGTQRSSMFSALIENYDKVLELQDEGLDSFGELAEANQKRVESFEGQLNILKDKMLAFTDGLQPLIFGSVELGNNLLDLVNDFGAIPTVVGLASASFLSFSDSGQKVKNTLMEMLGSKIQLVDGFNQIISAQNQRVESAKNEVAIAKQQISSTIETIAKLRLEHSARNDNTEAIAKQQQALVGLNKGLVASQKELTIATLKATAFQTVLSLGLSAAISGAIILIGKIAEELKDFAWSSEEAKEALGTMQDSLEEYNNLQVKTKETEKEIINLKSINEKIKDNTNAYGEQEGLINTIQEKLEGLANSYPSIASVLKSDNIELETKIKLLERQLELEEKQASMKAMQDLGGNVAQKIENGIKEQMDDIEYAKETLDLINKGKVDIGQLDSANQMIEEAKIEIEALLLQSEVAKATLETALSHGLITEDYYQKQVEKLDSTIEKYKEYGSGVRETTESVKNDTKNLVESAINDITSLSDSLTADFDSEASNSSLTSLKSSLSELEEGSEEAGEVLTKLKDTFKDMPSDVDTLAEAIDYLNGKLDETSESADMKDLNESYLEALENLEEAQDLIDSFADGLDASELRNIFDSDLMADYNGSLNDTANMLDHVKSKMQEMKDQSYEASVAMVLNNNDAWNSMTADMANSLNIQEQGFQDFVNSLGGMRQVDIQNAQNSADAQLKAEMNLVGQGAMYYAGFINSKAGNRETDMNNVLDFLNTQGVAEAKTIEQLAQLWAEYYKAKKAEITDTIDKMAGDYGDLGNVDPALMKQLHDLQRLNSNMNNYFANINTNFGGIGTGLSQATASAGSAISNATKPSSSSSSSGNKGSSSKDTQKEVADLELKIDRYYQLQDAIDDVTNALNENERATEKAEGKQQLNKLYEERVKLLERQKKAYEDLLKEQRNEAQEYRNAIATAGFKLDSSGNITNHKQQLEAMVKYANSLSGDAKSAQIEYVNSIVDIIEVYTTLTNSTIPDTEESIDEVAQAIKDLNKEHEEAIKYLNDLKDAYYNLNKAIKEIDNALSLIDAKMETATPEERVKLMEEEIALMKERQDLIQEQQKAYEKEAKDLSKELSSQGIKFDTSGKITNYDEVVGNLVNIANGLVGSAQEEAQEEIEELLELIEKYDEIMTDTLPELSEEWYEYANSIKEAEEAKAELVTSIQKDLTSAIENEYNKRYNALKTALQKEKDLYNQQYDEEDHQNTLAKKNQELAELQKAIDDMARDTSDAGQAKLKDLLQQYKDKQEEINEYIRDYEKEQGNNRFDEEMEKLDEELEEILSAENIADMVNKALVDGFVTIEDEVIELSTLMSDWLNDTGDGLYAMGDILREELINNLKTAQELMAGMGIVPTSIGSSPVSLSSLVDTKALELGAGNKSVENNVTIGSLLSVEGNVTEEVLPKIEAMLSEFESNFEEVIIEKLADEMSKY